MGGIMGPAAGIAPRHSRLATLPALVVAADAEAAQVLQRVRAALRSRANVVRHHGACPAARRDAQPVAGEAG